MSVLRGRRAWIALAVLALVLVGSALSVRWVLRPDNLARVIAGWVERELDATLTLAQAPGLRLVPRLQLTLAGARLERNDGLLASAEELRVALPWSSLWRGGLVAESISLRRPTIDWPALTTLLAELSDPDAPARTPRLPRIAVGVRIEDGTLLAGSGENGWRLDRVSVVTTPLQDGQPFNLDAGARVRGSQARTVSLTMRGRPANSATGLDLDDLNARLVVSPDNLPLEAGMRVELAGFLRLDRDGVGAADLAGQLPGWPDWLPNLLGFADDQAVTLSIRRSAGESLLVASLIQDQRRLDARLEAADLRQAMALLDRPLLALAALRSRWQLDTLALGDLRLHGIELEVGAAPGAAGAESAAHTDDGPGATRGSGDGNADGPGDESAGNSDRR